MSSLQRISPSVQVALPALRLIEPVEILDDSEPFLPTKEQDAWWAGFTATLDGEDARPEIGLGADRDAAWSFTLGTIAALKERRAIEAYELGHSLGLISGISEPPAGFSAPEKEAYRKGFAAGLAEADELERFEEWVAIEERERFEEIEAERYRITDADMWPAGCMS